MIKVYKDFYTEDMYDLLSQASENNHLSSDLVNSDLASLLYNHVEQIHFEDTTEDEIYDFIRFEMEIQTNEEIKENYKHIFDEYAFENGDDITSEDIEDFLCHHTAYIGNYEEDNTTYHVFTSF